MAVLNLPLADADVLFTRERRDLSADSNRFSVISSSIADKWILIPNHVNLSVGVHTHFSVAHAPLLPSNRLLQYRMLVDKLPRYRQ